MSQLRIRSAEPDAEGRLLSVTPESAGWRYVGFEAYRLAKGRRLWRKGGARELCLVLLSGRASITVGDTRYDNLGRRDSVFERLPPAAVYVPNDVDWAVEALSDLELAVASAPGHGSHPPRLIGPDDMHCERRGTGGNTRLVTNILPEDQPADSLLVVEVITPAGNWSSYPPHKHDRQALPEESLLEETYYHRINPPQGFAFQRVYTDDRALDETIAVEDGDLVMVPRGYHPVGAPYGYELYYLNVMAGPERIWRFSNDPAHDWVLSGVPAGGTTARSGGIPSA